MKIQKCNMHALVILSTFTGVVLTVLMYWFYKRYGFAPAQDFTWPLVAAQDLLTGSDPYARSITYGQGMVTYPLTTVVAVIPFAALPLFVAGPLLTGISVGLLTYGLLRTGEPWRLLVLSSYPFLQAVGFGNWPPLLLAAMYLPMLAPVVLVKPHTGFPVFASRFSTRLAAICLCIGLISLLLMPDWPWRWLKTLEPYQGRPALFYWWGWIPLIVLYRWRDERARYLLYTIVTPLRAYYDYLLLWYLPRKWWHMLLLTFTSWFIYITGAYWPLWRESSWYAFPLFLIGVICVFDHKKNETAKVEIQTDIARPLHEPVA